MGKILIGFFVGVMCGLIPLIFGLLTKSPIFGIIGIVSSALTGVLFSILGKSPFYAIGIALIFAVVLFAKNKNRKKHDDHHEDHGIYMDDE